MAGIVKYEVDYSRFTAVPEPEPLKELELNHLEADEAIDKAYENEIVKERPADKLHEMKIRMAMDSYEKRRAKDQIMHHYVVRDAGDTDAIGEYYPTGDERNSCPIYKNAHGITLTREVQPSKGKDEESYGWILGNIQDRRPLYGVMSDDLSVPTLGWQSFTAPGPMPTVRYYSHSEAARLLKDKGNAAMQDRKYVEAESWYTKALSTKLDPVEFPEPMAIILSNRSQVRLTLLKYQEAADDAEMALRHLQKVIQTDEATKLLKQKTYVRRAKALAAMKQFLDAQSVMKSACSQFPGNEEMQKIHSEMDLAASFLGMSGSSGPLLRFLGKTVEEMQTLVRDLANNLADAVFPMPLTKVLLKLEYVFSKADGPALSDAQTLLRANGGISTLLHIVEVQRQNHLEGQVADMDKLDSLCLVLSLISMACDGCAESMSLAAPQATAFFAALGSCNRKVGVNSCTRLVRLVAQAWKVCNSVSKEAVQPSSIVVERASAFLSKLVLREHVEGQDSFGGPDAPVVSTGVKDEAFELLSDLSSQGGRIEKRALRGAAPMLASFDGTGFLTSEENKISAMGECLLQKVVLEPSVLSATDVSNLLIGVQVLMHCKQTSSDAASPIEEICADLTDWALSEDGRYASQMLEAVAKALEYRLVKNSHELDRSSYEAAFASGKGWMLCPLLMSGPVPLAKPAMTCMGLMPSKPQSRSLPLGVILKSLLGASMSEHEPAAPSLKTSLADSAACRMSAAKLLAKCARTDDFLDFLRRDSDKCVQELVKLVMNVSLDGKGSLEALHDMLYVFYQIAQNLPDILCQHTSDTMMTMLVGMSKATVEDLPASYAESIIGVLKLNRKCHKTIQTILERFTTGIGVDAEDVLKTN